MRAHHKLGQATDLVCVYAENQTAKSGFERTEKVCRHLENPKEFI
jgi:hypothetical protein